MDSLIEGGFLFLQVLFWDPPNTETHTIVGVTEDRRFLVTSNAVLGGIRDSEGSTREGKAGELRPAYKSGQSSKAVLLVKFA